MATQMDWDSAPPRWEAALVEIPHFDARGMKLVYGRGDGFGTHHSFRMDIWARRDGALRMRCWARCADTDWRSYAITGVGPRVDPLAGSEVSDDAWLPKGVRLAYEQWVEEQL